MDCSLNSLIALGTKRLVFVLLLVPFVVPGVRANAQAPASPPGHTAAAPRQAIPGSDGKTWWQHVSVLAADNMEGRETGSPGLQRAQAYVVQQLKKAGLEPAAGKRSFYQPVHLQSRRINESASSAALVTDGQTRQLTLGDDGFFRCRNTPAAHVDAPLVFVGYGMRVPEKKYNDLEGLDLRGKIAVILLGSPAELPSELAAHYQSEGMRWAALRAAGAIGMIGIPNPQVMDIPWSRIKTTRSQACMSLVGAEFDEAADEQVEFAFNPASAEKLFAGSGHTFADVLAVAKLRKQLPRFSLTVRFRATVKADTRPVESANLVAALPGSDPRLKNEYVVLSAHLDHLGMGAPITGDAKRDRIYNGALDNAAGAAVLIDVAAALKQAKVHPKRSLLFLFVTGEEKGELGSKYFAARPTVPSESLVADVNIDAFLPLVPLKSVIVYGLNESTLGDNIRTVANHEGVEILPDPAPQRNTFIRSDQYSFIEKGIPSITFKVGFAHDQRKIMLDWLHQRYHAPSDDLEQPVSIPAAAKYEDITAELMMSVADEPQRPEWNPDSFFRRYAQSGDANNQVGSK